MKFVSFSFSFSFFLYVRYIICLGKYKEISRFGRRGLCATGLLADAHPSLDVCESHTWGLQIWPGGGFWKQSTSELKHGKKKSLPRGSVNPSSFLALDFRFFLEIGPGLLHSKIYRCKTRRPMHADEKMVIKITGEESPSPKPSCHLLQGEDLILHALHAYRKFSK